MSLSSHVEIICEKSLLWGKQPTERRMPGANGLDRLAFRKTEAGTEIFTATVPSKFSKKNNR